MSTPNDGGPAFPIPPAGTGDPRDSMTVGSSGLSLRDYFAARALQGMLADTGCGGPFEAYAKDAYLHADAMLAERSKTNGGSA